MSEKEKVKEENKRRSRDFIAQMANMIEKENAKQNGVTAKSENIVEQIKNLSPNEMEEVRGAIFGEVKSEPKMPDIPDLTVTQHEEINTNKGETENGTSDTN